MSDSKVQFSTTEVIGSTLGTAQDAHIGLVRGYQAARNPDLVAAREEANQKRIAALTAQLLADLDA